MTQSSKCRRVGTKPLARPGPGVEWHADPTVDGDLPHRFRRVYFHLYTNSNASRAETLLADLSLLLLTKLASEKTDLSAELTDFLAGKGSANQLLLPALRASYPRLVRNQDRFELADDPLREALGELDGVELTQRAAHALGDAFQALIGPRIRGDKGQFFTPRSLVRAMVSILSPRAGDRILDPACGTGGFLYQALAHIERSGEKPQHVHGADKDRDLARLAEALLASRSTAARAFHLNSLDGRAWMQAGLRDEYDLVVTNPPFGTKIPIRDPAILEQYELAREWKRTGQHGSWHPTDHLLENQDPQVLFLELCIRRLRAGGRMGIVLPEGLFGNQRQGYLWDYIRREGEIVALLDCPRTTFQPGTDTKTNVLFFRKETRRRRSSVAIGVALGCGHDRRGRGRRTDGTPHPDDFAALGRSLRIGDSVRCTGAPWHRVTLTNPYYLVPRYYVEEAPSSPAEQSLVAGAEWTTLGALATLGWLELRKGHEVGSEAYGTGDVPFVRTSDIANFEISSDPTKSVSEDVYASLAPQQRLRPGTILMVVDGRYRIGATAIVTANSARCVVQSHLRIIDTRDPEHLDPFALLFALSLPTVRRRVRDLVFVQSTLGTLGARLLELQVPLLSGPGPWSDTVQRFRHTIEQRSQLLTTLAELSGPTIEL